MKTCVDRTTPFEYIKPAPLNQTMQLLTMANKHVVGVWKGPAIGEANQQYKAWRGLPDRDKDLEQKLGYL